MCCLYRVFVLFHALCQYCTRKSYLLYWFCDWLGTRLCSYRVSLALVSQSHCHRTISALPSYVYPVRFACIAVSITSTCVLYSCCIHGLSVMVSYCTNVVFVEGILLYSYCIRSVLVMCADRRGYSYCVDSVNVL